MNQCPKCSSCRIIGPTYSRGGSRCREVLVYQCMQCGYMHDEPTHDNRRPMPDWLKKIAEPTRAS